MAQIDHSIYFQQQSPDIFGSLERGMKLGESLKKRRLEGEERDAMKSVFKADESGKITVGDLSGLAKVNPQKAFEIQQVQRKTQLEDQAREIDTVSRLAFSIKDQATYDMALQEASRLGLDVSKYPRQFDPGLVQQLQMRSMTAKERLEQKWKQIASEQTDRGLDIKEREVKAKEIAAKASVGASGANLGKVLTPAQKKVDEEFAKEYNDFVASGGYADVQKNIAQLKEVKELLGKKDSATGPIIGTIGSLPWLGKGLRDVFTPEGAAMQDRVEEVVQRNLRLILGAQFTEREGQRLIERAYNPRLSEEENAKRVGALLEQIESAAKAKTEAASYYEKNGTLMGFKGVKTEKKPPKDPPTKIVDGVAYRKVEGGWEAID